MLHILLLAPLALAAEDPTAAAQRAIGARGVVREAVSLRIERGQPALLALVAHDPEDGPPSAAEDLLSCPDAVAGEATVARWEAALIVGGQVASTVRVPSPDHAEDADDRIALPRRNSAANNWTYWARARRPRRADEGALEPTPLLALRDVTGDGRAWEARLVVYGGACGHLQTLLLGYSARQRGLIVYPAVHADGTADPWPDDVYPAPSERKRAPLAWKLTCGDHGNDREITAVWVFDPKREAFVETRRKVRACAE